MTHSVKDQYVDNNTVTEIYEYIEENIDDLLANENIKNSLDPQTNKTTQTYIEKYGERQGYILSLHRMMLTYHVFLKYNSSIS